MTERSIRKRKKTRWRLKVLIGRRAVVRLRLALLLRKRRIGAISGVCEIAISIEAYWVVNGRTSESTGAVAFLRLHLLVYEPESVDVSRDVAESAARLEEGRQRARVDVHSEEDVDEEVARAAGNESVVQVRHETEESAGFDERCCGWGKQYRDEDEENVRAFDHCG